EVVVKKSLLAVFVLVLIAAVPTFAGPMPSKTAANQSLDSRAADIAMIRDVAANDQVAAVLAQHGFTQAQVNDRLAQLSPQDVHQLAQNLNQLQAAGLTQQEWIWVGIGALAALILVVALSRTIRGSCIGRATGSPDSYRPSWPPSAASSPSPASLSPRAPGVPPRLRSSFRTCLS